MNWITILVFVGYITAIAGSSAFAGGNADNIDYVEGFEADNPVKPWVSKGEYRVNYAGLTDERSHSGKQSFKLDLTIVKDGDYNYWCGPTLDLPAVEGVTLQGNIYIAEISPGISVGLGTSYYMPAVAHATDGEGRGIAQVIGEFSQARTGEWIQQQADVQMMGQTLARHVIGEEVPGIYLEKWGLQIFSRAAKPGSRLVLYIDDVSISGDIPADWDRRTEQQLTDWRVAYNARQQADLTEYRETMSRINREAHAIADQLPKPDAVAKQMRGPWGDYAIAMLVRAHELAAQTASETANVTKPPIEASGEVNDLWDTRIRPLQYVRANLRQLAKTSDPCLIFVQPNPITNYHTLPTNILIDGQISHTLAMFASPNQYEPASFVLLSNVDSRVDFEVNGLRTESGAQIPKDAIDLRVVKAWYQAGVTVSQTDKRLLVSELLLHDDSLVQVDLDKKSNTVRDIDSPRDASTLQPLQLIAGQPKQFWLTVHIAPDTPPGQYTGKIQMRLGDKPPRELNIEMEVLPLQLADADKDYGLYYRGKLTDSGDGPISSDHKTPAQLEADFRNMLAHGVTQPDVYERASLSNGQLDANTLGRYLDIKQKAGLPLDPLLYLGVGAIPVRDDAALEERIVLYRQLIAFAQSRGIEDVYFYGQDEAMGEVLKNQRRVWETIHELDGKVWAACSSGFFDVVGDLLDLPVIARHAPAEVEKVHKLGRKAYVYSVPSGGPIEKPFSQRYRWGMWLDRSGFDGIHNYCYQHAEGPDGMMGRAWDDFDSTIYRSINYTYPAIDGPIDTLQWEAVRGGIDDARYLATLRALIRQAEASQNPQAVEAAAGHRRWLESVDINRDLQKLRRSMADRAVQLQQHLNGNKNNL